VLFAVSVVSAAETPRNVVIMIGDGMGVAHLSLTRITEPGGRERLNIDSMPIGGFARTYSQDSLITDSAAAATALATGCKTKNGMISTTAEGASIPTILELMQKRGMLTGLVTTTTITHATPAGFGAHVSSRGDESDIAPQYIAKKIDVLLGGGRSFFIPQGESLSRRKDSLNLISEAKSAGYNVAETKDQLMQVNGGRVLGLFQMGHLTMDAPEPSLADMTGKALEVLSKGGKGFFLMVEGGQIDFAAHANNADGVVKQVVGFDDAVGRALRFARLHGDTLVIVTADHETGGLSLCYPEKNSGKRIAAKWGAMGHSASDVPVFAEGPGSRKFSGLQNNTDIPKKIAALLGVKGLAAVPASADKAVAR
jgi:alkaline phosphatase